MIDDAGIAGVEQGVQAGEYRIAGRHCESTDVLADGVGLPAPEVGDIIEVYRLESVAKTLA